MATMITNDCINCGACEPECPNNAISQGETIFVIDPLLCTECVGFHDYEACAAVCPVDCCVTDPNNIETEEVLIARARSLHQDVQFGENFQSRFRKAPSEPATAPSPQKSASAAAPAAASASPASAGHQTPVPPTKPVAAPAVKTPPPAEVPKPVAQPKKEARPKKTFPRELPVSFEELLNQYKTSGSLGMGPGKALIVLAQPLIGALPHVTKKKIEEAVHSPLFTVAGSTGLNILLNGLLYPLVCVAGAAAYYGPAMLFSQETNIYILLGILFATAESIYRLRDGIFRVKPANEMNFSAAFYGAPLGMILQPLLARQAGMIRGLPIPVDGFYSKGFVEKLERERRYGNVYTMEDRGGAYLLRMEFPRCIPDIGLPGRLQLPNEMPDYDYDLALKDGQFIIKGRCTDERVRKVSASIGAFPPEFTTTLSLSERVVGFAHHFENKLLEVLLVKDRDHRWGMSYR